LLRPGGYFLITCEWPLMYTCRHNQFHISLTLGQHAISRKTNCKVTSKPRTRTSFTS
jgi:hypothetical protein